MPDDYTVSINPQDMLKLNGMFNPKREEYNDFKVFWKGIPFQGAMSRNWINMFQTRGWGQWDNDNVDTGRMRASLVQSLTYQAGFAAADKRRIYSKKSMTWGINIDSPNFILASGYAYPIYPLERNPIAYVSGTTVAELTRYMGIYIINVFREFSGQAPLPYA